MTVEQLQHLLAYLGYDTGGVDGIYGPKTKKAVTDFQREYGGLAVDGKAGELTEAALRKAVGEGWTRPGEVNEDVPNSGTSDDPWDDIKYFTREEFRCTCGGRYCNGFPVEPDMEMVKILDIIRENSGPFTPNSSIRCPERNAEVGGAANSQHLYGTAADISVPGKTPQEAAAFAETLLPNTGGIGIYPWGIHVDTRKDKARWRG